MEIAQLLLANVQPISVMKRFEKVLTKQPRQIAEKIYKLKSYLGIKTIKALESYLGTSGEQ